MNWLGKVKITRCDDGSGWEVHVPNNERFIPYKHYWFPTFEQAVRMWPYLRRERGGV